MKRLTQIGILLSAVIFIFGYSEQAQTAASAASPKSGKNFTAHLSGNEEVPSVNTKATGQAIFKLNADDTTLNYKLIVANLDSIIQSHIHIGPSGQNGPVTVFLFGPVTPGGTQNGVLAEGTITAGDLIGPLAGQPLSALIDEMNAGNTYVNVHTATVPSGEIRGQIK